MDTINVTDAHVACYIPAAEPIDHLCPPRPKDAHHCLPTCAKLIVAYITFADHNSWFSQHCAGKP